MTIGGWIFMLTSVTFVISLAVWCFSRILREQPGSPEDID
jgi:hypothetical protein